MPIPPAALWRPNFLVLGEFQVIKQVRQWSSCDVQLIWKVTRIIRLNLSYAYCVAIKSPKNYLVFSITTSNHWLAELLMVIQGFFVNCFLKIWFASHSCSDKVMKGLRIKKNYSSLYWFDTGFEIDYPEFPRALSHLIEWNCFMLALWSNLSRHGLGIGCFSVIQQFYFSITYESGEIVYAQN